MRLMQCLPFHATGAIPTQSVFVTVFSAALLCALGANASAVALEQTGQTQSAPGQVPAARVKALYLTGWTVGLAARLEHYVELANRTELNAYVVDIKDDDGYVGYESQVPLVREIKGWIPKYKVEPVIRAFHDNGIRVIGRVACFKDPVLSSKRTDLAIKDRTGKPWKDNKKRTWLDPYNPDAWAYLVDIAREGIRNGFDEIQFDYVRFANDGPREQMVFDDKGKPRHQAINAFLAYARLHMPEVVLSADVFGIICETPEDQEGIGQYLEYVGCDVDHISPMAYPSHYALGQVVNGTQYAKPDLDPYGVVHNTLLKARRRTEPVQDYRAGIRPYLQDFTATWLGGGNYQRYGAEQVRQQIKAVYDAGYEEWILWNASNKYSESAFLPEGAKQPAPKVIDNARPKARPGAVAASTLLSMPGRKSGKAAVLRADDKASAPVKTAASTGSGKKGMKGSKKPRQAAAGN